MGSACQFEERGFYLLPGVQRGCLNIRKNSSNKSLLTQSEVKPPALSEFRRGGQGFAAGFSQARK